MSTHIRQTFRLRCLLLFIVLALGQMTARAHGDEDHGDEAKPIVAATTSGAGETSLHLRLVDLGQSAPGTEAPLENAKIRGFLKRAGTGEILSRVSAHSAAAPGSYDVHFNGDNETIALSGTGRYELELNIRQANGEAVDTIVPFSLKPDKAAEAVTTPLWRRLLITLGALALIILFVLIRKLLARRKSPPGSSGEMKSRSRDVSAALLLAVMATAASARHAWAHGDEDHGDKSATPAAVPAPAVTAPSSTQKGETSDGATSAGATSDDETSIVTTAGNIRITLTARTKSSATETIAPGEVALPSQTAQLLQIKTAPVQVAQLATGISFSGQIAPNPNGVVRVASIVPGRITRLNVAQGEPVQQGQVVAVVESRAIGEAQSAYSQAQARFRNAQSNLSVVKQQARAGVFSRAPLETAQRSQAEAQGDARQGQAAVQQAQVALDNATRLARVGGFASPALEASRNVQAQNREALKTAQAALQNARASTESAQAELQRQRQQAKAGLYVSRPTQEAQRLLVAAQSARAAAQSEVATTRANLSRARILASEGLVSRRDLEAAQQAFDTATARLETAQADERASQQELSRQQQLASTDAVGVAEVQQAQAALSSAQADVQTRDAQVQRARAQLQVSGSALSRERTIFEQNLANRREIGTARANLQAARAGFYKAQRTLEVAAATLRRERLIFKSNLNNTSQVQQARAGYVSAQADLRAAQSTLSLLKTSPGGSVAVPIRAPMSGVVQTRDVAVGELIGADAPILTIVNLNTVAIEAALFEADFARVRVGSPVSITTDAAPGRTFGGRISFLGSALDPQTRTATARALLSNPGTLRPGMFAQGQIQTGKGKLSVAVPESAVLDDGAAKIVFVAKGAKYERREVAIGNTSNNRVEIKSGLKQGEKIVVQGAAALRAQAAKGV